MAQSDSNLHNDRRNDSNGIRRLVRIAPITFVVGSVTFIVIGLAHTATQLTTLSSDAVMTAYRAGGPITVNGAVVDGWDLFAGTSLLMGFYGVTLGLANLGALVGSGRPDRLPPPGVCAANVVMLVGIVAVGARYLGPVQLIGGAVGIGLFGLPLTAAFLLRVQEAGRVGRCPTAVC